MVGRPSRGGGCGALQAERREVEVVDKGIKETDGMLGSHGVVEPLWEQDRFVAVCAVDKTHADIKLQGSKKVSRCREQCYSLPKHCVFTQSGAAPDCLQRPLVPRSCFRQQVRASVKTLPQALYKASCQQGKRCSTRHLPAC